MKKKRINNKVKKAAVILAKNTKKRKKLALKILKIIFVNYKNWQQRWKLDEIWLTNKFYSKFTYYYSF